MARTILLGTDGTVASEAALAWLAELARGARSRPDVVVENVQLRPLVAWPDPGIDIRAVEAALLERGQSIAGSAAERLRSAGCPSRALARLGSPAQALIDEAAELSAGMIVLGTRGHGMLRGFALGSTALRVVHGSPIPVVVVHPDARVASPGAGGRRRVLLAIDGSEPSMHAAEAVVAWSPDLGSPQVEVVHVQEPMTVLEAILPPHEDVLRQWGRAQGEAAARGVLETLGKAGIPAQLRLVSGDPAEVILGIAREHAPDLIAIGSRGLGAAHHALVGSVALKVAAHASVPVLVAR